MNIFNLKVNGIRKPLGYNFNSIYISYELDDVILGNDYLVMLEVSSSNNFKNLIYKSKLNNIVGSKSFSIEIDLKVRTRYYYRICIKDLENNIHFSNIEWFETGKMDEPWQANWISTPENISHPILNKEIEVNRKVINARLYCTGLGLYEANLNGEKIGDEQLSPGYHDYSKWLQIQTYDITELFTLGLNYLEFTLGNGWYKGNFGFNGGSNNIYGDRFLLIGEIHISYEDGSTEVIKTDSTWKYTNSNITESGIYYGEDRNDNVNLINNHSVTVVDYGYDLLKDRLSVPIKIKEKINPAKILTNDKEELILDMGQNMVGWVAFHNKLSRNSNISIEYGEILQNGYFYRDNLRHARAKYTYVSDGKVKWIRPKFSFFGFRYVKITGITKEEIKLEDFVGEVVFSDLEQTGHIETNNSDINQLFSNIFWSQKGNFVDVPTDCPQRDERMGWTGDAQVFSETALYNMDAYAFYKKYLNDLQLEQAPNGAVPMTVPSMTLEETNESTAVWGDVCAILPWNLYKFYGNKNILKDSLPSMKKWISYIQSKSQDYLWTEGFQFGDWLALDGPSPYSPLGGTEEKLIATIYSYYSTKIVADSLNILDKSGSHGYYELANKIKSAIQNEYLSSNGRLVVNTQTAYTLILYFEIFEPHQKETLLENFKNILKKSNYTIQTGFVGTPLLCLTLSKYGEDEIAYTLLFNKDCPSWLYAIDMGATTIWERWDSVLPNGVMNENGMNSLNHYAYGSIGQWMYEYLLGIKQFEGSVGFTNIQIQPKINWRLNFVKGFYHSPSGKVDVSWENINNDITLNVTIPPGVEGRIILENTEVNYFSHYHQAFQKGKNVEVIVTQGTYKFTYQQKVKYKVPNKHWSLNDFSNIPVGYQLLQKFLPHYFSLKPYKKNDIKNIPLVDLPKQNVLSVTNDAYLHLLTAIKNLDNL
ncbi:family 78 glycoside hydrolase catalytic domain [Enterococcus entomosocium]|uniref:alpha-L-rhamnosidase n=1 Tax=Enterococcus entomosocium TaxID=3034352 RepID=UPI003D6A371B